MGYRKFRSDHLFTGQQMLDEHYVLITDNGGEVEAIVPIEEAGEGVEYIKGIVSPGFVNCHCHLELSHMKGVIPKRTGMTDFLLSVVSKRFSDPLEIIDRMSIAMEEIFHSGIVAVGDICNTSYSVGVKQMSRIYYHNFIEAIGFDESHAVQRFNEAKEVFDKFADLEERRGFGRSIVPHAPYSVSTKLLKMINEFAANDIVSMHNQESAGENDLFLTGEGEMLRLYDNLKMDIGNFKPAGVTSLQALYKNFDETHNLLLVHNVYTSYQDVAALGGRRKNVFWCLCPNANLYITGQLPDIDMFIKSDNDIVIGTDSLASNDQLSILEELKTIQKHFSNIPTETLLQWATIKGAKALKIDDRFGTFEKGKSPGVVRITGIRGGRLSENSTSTRII